MTEVQRSKRWSDFASGLEKMGLNLVAGENVTVTNRGAADLKVLGLMLLARTLSNLKGAMILLRENRLVEARILARCCYENQYWVTGLIVDGDKFRTEIVNHEMQQKRMRMQTLFNTQEGLTDDMEQKMRTWMRDHKKWKDAKTLDPKGVAMRGAYQSYVFYQHLSWDSHPSIETLNRYYIAPDESGVLGIDFDSSPTEEEIVETLNLLCLPVIGVFLGVSELLGNEQTSMEIGMVAAEYKRLTEETGQLQSLVERD